ncbi:hypothetical protein RRF57_008774 [Xylaria bambusicola]|uniref:Uncharacterized protein n=1 Tax=Xylaria bambusicola TaxID=326684 RepID=A0AAN7UUG7_9PEZI
MTELDETKIPTKQVTAKPMGMVSSCDQRASRGLPAKRAKSGSLTMSVAKLAIELKTPFTNSQASSLPSNFAGWLIMGPGPPALTKAQMKKAIPAVGTK